MHEKKKKRSQAIIFHGCFSFVRYFLRLDIVSRWVLCDVLPNVIQRQDSPSSWLFLIASVSCCGGNEFSDGCTGFSDVRRQQANDCRHSKPIGFLHSALQTSPPFSRMLCGWIRRGRGRGQSQQWMRVEIMDLNTEIHNLFCAFLWIPHFLNFDPFFCLWYGISPSSVPVLVLCLAEAYISQCILLHVWWRRHPVAWQRPDGRWVGMFFLPPPVWAQPASCRALSKRREPCADVSLIVSPRWSYSQIKEVFKNLATWILLSPTWFHNCSPQTPIPLCWSSSSS